MIKKYIIDGNNLIGKIRNISQIQKKDPHQSRAALLPILDRYFANKKFKVSLHFDGFPFDPLTSNFLKIHYSHSSTADKKIKQEMDKEKNPKTLCIVSSDHELMNYARVCSSKIIKSEEFAVRLQEIADENSEANLIKGISQDEIKRAFGID